MTALVVAAQVRAGIAKLSLPRSRRFQQLGFQPRATARLARDLAALAVGALLLQRRLLADVARACASAVTLRVFNDHFAGTKWTWLGRLGNALVEFNNLADVTFGHLGIPAGIVVPAPFLAILLVPGSLIEADVHLGTSDFSLITLGRVARDRLLAFAGRARLRRRRVPAGAFACRARSLAVAVAVGAFVFRVLLLPLIDHP